MTDKNETPRQMPIIHVGNYSLSGVEGGITAKEKADFLEKFFETGNETLAAKFAGHSLTAFKGQFKVDPFFAGDFYTVRDAMKHQLEQTMYQNGLTPRGFMDRMAWLRKHYPHEYDPKTEKAKDDSKAIVDQLANKLKEYEIIPKKDVIEVKEEKE